MKKSASTWTTDDVWHWRCVVCDKTKELRYTPRRWRRLHTMLPKGWVMVRADVKCGPCATAQQKLFG